MPEKLYVHADLGDGSILLAGQLIVDDKLGRFKYSKAYIDHPRAFALTRRVGQALANQDTSAAAGDAGRIPARRLG
jgi:hypothetical protein